MSDNRSYSCKPCDKSFNGPIPYAQHCQSQKHHKKIQVYINLHPLVRKDVKTNSQFTKPVISKNYLPENEEYSCKVCVKQFDSPIPYKDHMESYIHKNQLNKQSCTKLTELVLNKEDFSSSTEFTSYHYRDTQKKLKVFGNTFSTRSDDLFTLACEDVPSVCKSCEVTFTGPLCAEQHFKSDFHKSIADLKKNNFNIETDENRPVVRKMKELVEMLCNFMYSEANFMSQTKSKSNSQNALEETPASSDFNTRNIRTETNQGTRTQLKREVCDSSSFCDVLEALKHYDSKEHAANKSDLSVSCLPSQPKKKKVTSSKVPITCNIGNSQNRVNTLDCEGVFVSNLPAKDGLHNKRKRSFPLTALKDKCLNHKEIEENVYHTNNLIIFEPHHKFRKIQINYFTDQS